MFKSILVVLGLFISLNAGAELPPAPDDNVSEPGNELPQLACNEVVAALKEYNVLARENEIAVADFITSMSIGMEEWYSQWVPLEAGEPVVKSGTFAPLKEAVEVLDETVADVYENSEQLNMRMERIIEANERCLQ